MSSSPSLTVLREQRSTLHAQIAAIEEFRSGSLVEVGEKTIIDVDRRAGGTADAMDPATTGRYAIRATVERSSAHLKDWLLPSKLLVKRHKKVNSCLLSGVVAWRRSRCYGR